MSFLSTRKLDAYYGDSQVLFGVDFEIERGEIAALVGANGAGKSTLLKTVCGLLRAPREAVTFAGDPIGGLAPGKIVRRESNLSLEGFFVQVGAAF